MGTQDVDAKVFDIAHDLMRRGPTQEEIDGRFLFEVWDEEWLSWVEETRRSLFGHGDVPFPREDLSVGLPGLQDQLEPLMKKQLDEAVEAKCDEHGLWESDVVGHILTGSPIALPRLSLITNPSGIAELPVGLKNRPTAALLIFSDDVRPSELSKVYQQHFRYINPELHGTERKDRFQESQDWANLVRTWTIMCLAETPGTTDRKAIALWNKTYPQHSYGSPEETTPSKRQLRGGSVTSAAQTQYSRDKKVLFDRLRLTR